MDHSVTSTLFRFVNYRNPKLIEEETVKSKFVLQPPGLQTGVFYNAVTDRLPGVSKMLALKKAAADFQAPFSSVEGIKSLNEEMYTFSSWIARNKKTYADDDLVAELAVIAAPLAPNAELVVWNNLFYQIITQQNFYLKEALMQMLVANHVVNLARPDMAKYSDFNRDLVNASLGLPVELFGDYSKTPGKQNDNDTVKSSLPTGYLKKQLNLAEAKFRLSDYDKLTDELKHFEGIYTKAFSQDYDEAYASYQQTIAPLLENYYEAVEAARKSFCQLPGSDKPYDPNDPCQQPELVPYPTLPDFNFSFGPEVTPVKIKGELTPSGYNTLLEVLGYDFEEGTSQQAAEIFDKYPTYKSFYPQIENARQKATMDVSANATSSKKRVNVGGVPVQVARMPALMPFVYTICGTRINRNTLFTLTLSVPDSTWQVLSVSAVVTYPDDSTSVKTINAPAGVFGNNMHTFSGFYNFAFPENLGDDSPVIDFQITFTNGSKYIVPDVDALMAGSCAKGVATEKNPGTGPVPQEPEEDAPFVPSGFGFRAIGVADYLKVEQTVQCYVEGEVSHIENIMAREYRERSTRLLRRSEETTTVSDETEREKMSDTTTTDRYELQSEVNRVISQAQDMGGSVNASYNGKGGFSLSTGLSYATSNAQENSIREAETRAQEITERAMDRVVSRIKEERISKVLEEFEENNKHGFDNRQGSQHVVGVYRWVDKLYKNQILNYGKRMMFEFMIPEPAQLHIFGMEEAAQETVSESIEIPDDPRVYEDAYYAIPTYLSLNDTNIAYWAGKYNVEIEPKPESIITVGDSFTIKWDGVAKLDNVEANSGSGKITIPEGYKATRAVGVFNAVSDNSGGRGRMLSLTVGNKTATYTNPFGQRSMPLDSDKYTTQASVTASSPYKVEVTKDFSLGTDYSGEIPVSYTLGNHAAGDISVTISCRATNEYINGWKLRTHKAILNAYEEAMAAYNEKNAQQLAGVQVKGTNPGFYRQIENLVLRKNCLSYIVSQNPNAGFTYGKNMTTGDTLGDYEVNLANGLDNYSAKLKFLEQAFEWDILSYNFYPFYWGSRSNWSRMYQYDGTDDALFRNFMQAGMARVIVTVRPGFERAVSHYMATGQVWNGGDVPLPGDKLYLSIVNEIESKDKAGPTKEGKAWITRLPTTLTILQADSIGLKVEKALPCNCGDADEFEPGTVIPCDSNFQFTNSQIGQSSAQKIRFAFTNIDHFGEDDTYTIGQYGQKGLWPRIYECMGQIITIDRDSNWGADDNAVVLFERLAEKLSLINGVQAEQADSPVSEMSPDGIRFTVDTSINPDFVFIKKSPDGGWTPEFDMLRVVAGNGTVRVYYNEDYAPGRIADKIGAPIQDNEVNALLPIGRFSV